MTTEISIEDFRQVAEGLAQKYLGEYTQLLEQVRSIEGKEINDALWGTIRLTPLEVALLDSPLLQRLRHVRQLGVAHWVYPGAIHTRFEHTLGVLHQLQQLITALNAAAPDSPIITRSEANVLRVSALLHDVGHAAFSHVSEKAMEALPSFSVLSKNFSKTWRSEDKQLSEMLAYYIATSPAMRKLLQYLIARLNIHIEFDDHQAQPPIEAFIEKISSALIGQKISDKCPLLHELISGPFDADKLDYLVRDAKQAGIPSILDIPRLIQKLALRKLVAKNLPHYIAGQLQVNDDAEAWLFGIKMSSKSVLDELQLARTLAYSKIYRHPKVIAVEQMIRAFIEALSKICDSKKLLVFLYNYPDDVIISMGKSDLLKSLELNRRIGRNAKEALDSAEKLLKSVRERRLWNRAFLLSSKDVLEESYEPLSAKGISKLRRDLDHPQNRDKFVKLLRGESFRLLQSHLGNSAPSRLALDSMIMIRVLSSASEETQIGRAYMIPAVGEPVQLSAYMKGAEKNWVDLYVADQPKVYIFCPSDISYEVFVAAERLIRTKYNVVLPERIAESSKRKKELLNECKRKIPPELWRGIPFDISPMPSRLMGTDVNQKIQAFDQMRFMYQEPESPDWLSDDQRISISKDKRTKAWLKQFRTDEHVNCALHILKKFRMLSRENTIEAISSFLTARPAFRNAWIVPFGSAKDSGAVQAYFGKAIPCIQKVGTLDEYQRNGQGFPLIFIDDFIGSGNQAIDILAAWFNREDLRRPLGEERLPLSSEIVACMQSSMVAFVFVSGWDAGISAITEMANKVGLKAEVYCHIPESDLPFADKCLRECFSTQEVESFLQRCQEIGIDLLRSEQRAEPLSEEKLLERALGYGGKGMLLASFLNVPTQTLTAIWASGKSEGVAWSPLLMRQKKS